MNKNKKILVDIIGDSLNNDPMYSELDLQNEIQNHIVTCIEGVANSAWVSSRRASDLVRQICQSYVSYIDNMPITSKKKSKYD